MKQNRINRLAFSLLCALAFASCAKEVSVDGPDGPGTGKDDAMVRFSMAIPGNSGPSTRAMSETDEGYVETVDVMVFRADGDKKHYYTAIGHELDNSAINKKTFEAVLPVGTWDIVVLTNARDIINNSGIGHNESKATALAKLSVALAADATDAAKKLVGFRIPMMGHKAGIQIDSNTELIDKSGSGGVDNSIKMVRMVSRIDVSLSAKAASGSESGTGNANFALNSVRLYNYSTRGRVVPDLSSWPADNKATTPCPPNTGYGTAAYNGESYAPLTYTAADELSSEKNLPDALTRVIYTFEAAAGSSATPLSNPSLVIGGYYNGSSTESYYRVDFYDDNTKQYVALLRNHRHLANIRSVTGPGYDTPDKAFRSKPVNIEAEVLRWDESDMTGIAFDGQHTLSVSQNEFTFFRDERTASDDDNSLFVKTDYAPSTGSGGGWTIEKIVNAADGTTPVTWLTVTPTSGAVNVKTETKLTFGENTSGSVRSAVVWFAAGRLRYPVTVTQTTAPELKLEIVDSSGEPITELVFESSNAGTQQFFVKWKPKTADVNTIRTTIGTYAFPDGQGPANGTVVAGGTGSVTYSISPPNIAAEDIAANPLIEKVSKVDFTTTNGVSRISRSIFLRQVNYGVAGEVNGSYRMDKTHTFRLKSNAAWRISAITQNPSDGSSALLAPKSGDNLAVGLSGMGNPSPGDAITFTLASDILANGSTLTGSIDVTFVSVDGKFDPVTLTIVCIAGLDYTYSGNPYFFVRYEDGNSGNAVTYTTTHCPTGYSMPTLNQAILMYVYKAALGADHGLQNGHYWTTAKCNVTTPIGSWYIDMDEGTVTFKQAGSTSTAYIRCVQNNPATGRKYPYVDVSNMENGPIIVSRDEHGGANPEAIRENAIETDFAHEYNSPTNRVPARLQVANTNLVGRITAINAAAACRSRGDGWRLPTHRELMLIKAMGGAAAAAYTSNQYTIPDPVVNTDPLYDIPGFTVFSDNGADIHFETSTIHGQYRDIYTVTLPGGPSFGYSYVQNIFATNVTFNARCVRDVE